MLEEDLRQEYIDAENVKEECLRIYSTCELNIYDFITFQEPWSVFFPHPLRQVHRARVEFSTGASV